MESDPPPRLDGPPPLPPVLREEEPAAPVAAPAPEPAMTGVIPEALLTESRLHPLTLAIAAWNVIRSNLVTAFILVLVSGNWQLLLIVIPFAALAIAAALIRYYTFTYRIEDNELITRQGLINRQERNIPLNRVQDIRIDQGLLHRLLNVVDVNVETAGGAGAEATLSVLSLPEAERLRETIYAQSRKAAAKPKATAAGEATSEDAGEVEVVPTRDVRLLSIKELAIAGLTSNQTASLMIAAAAFFGFIQQFLPMDRAEELIRTATNFLERFVSQGAAVVVLTVVATIVLGTIASMITSIVVFYGFRLSLRGEDLQRNYGLLTKRSSNLPRRRIQLLRVDESLLRRPFKLASLRADTAGSAAPDNDGSREGRNVLLPIIPKGELESLLPNFFPDIDDTNQDWRKVSRRAIYRGTFVGSMFLLLIALIWTITSVVRWGSLVGLWPLALIPLAYLINVLNYRHLGYSLGDRYFRTRRGWLGRATLIVPIRNIQSVSLQQSVFDRRHGVMTLIVDSAGQAFTGGPPRIDNVPEAEARELAATLAQRASQMRYQWSR